MDLSWKNSALDWCNDILLQRAEYCRSHHELQSDIISYHHSTDIEYYTASTDIDEEGE
jgi:hypothetical protein